MIYLSVYFLVNVLILISLKEEIVKMAYGTRQFMFYEDFIFAFVSIMVLCFGLPLWITAEIINP